MLIYGVFQIQITTEQADFWEDGLGLLIVLNKYTLIFYTAHVMFDGEVLMTVYKAPNVKICPGLFSNKCNVKKLCFLQFDGFSKNKVQSWGCK